MSDNEELVKLLEKLIKQEGKTKAKKSLLGLLEDIEKPTLTIISNLGSHRIPERYLRGEIFVASEGNLDFSNKIIIEDQYKQILGFTREKLLEKNWGRIYLIPTGHVTLSLQLKMLVYRVTRLSTVDIFYSDGNFFELDINPRLPLTKSN